MEKCIICNKETDEVNASNQSVHIQCMNEYAQTSERLIVQSLKKYGRVL